MSDQANFWNQDWIEMQRRFLEQWGQMSRPAPQPMGNLWAGTMEQWWQNMAPGTDGNTREFMQRMMDQGKAFFEMSEVFSRNQTLGEDWQNGLEKAFGDLKNLFRVDNPISNLQRMMGGWQTPLQSWQSFFPNNAGFQGMDPSLFSGVSGFRPGDFMMDNLYKMFSMPGIGEHREKQEKLLEFNRLWIEYQEILTAYNEYFQEFGVEAVEQLQDKIMRRVQSDDEKDRINSGRQIYDMWIDSCEEVYSDYVFTEDYTVLHGELINAMFALKQQSSSIMEDILVEWNLPTRTEMDTVTRRVQETRRDKSRLNREMRQLNKRIDRLEKSDASDADDKIAALSKEKTALKRQLTDLKKQLGDTREENTGLKKQLDDFQGEFKTLQEQLKTLAGTVETLQTEKAAAPAASLVRKKTAAKKTAAKKTATKKTASKKAAAKKASPKPAE